MDATNLKQVLDAHMKWLRGEAGGVRANLSYADLRSANLSYADLRSANLRSANLSYADLRSANLRYADLRSANLRSANLSYADLSYANGVDASHLRRKQILPEVGVFTAFKKLRDGIVAQLEITGERVGGVCGRKCRASEAAVIAFFNTDTTPAIGLVEARSLHNSEFVYRLGETVKPDSYDGSMVNECSNGIHFFLSFDEAAEFNL